MTENTVRILTTDGEVIHNPSSVDFEELKDKIFNLYDDYWNLGNGEVILTYSFSPKISVELMVAPNPEYGVHLRYCRISESTSIEWISLKSMSSLGEEVAEFSYELYASTGLFIASEKAWLAINYFCNTGERTTEIEWISSNEIPEGIQY
ncbi:MAG: hypothetical protein KME17_02010 [Cyanosarcina radialis HA8281-LM2]|jgi:hypothetical protein|nr:hypothetical protein [Cyanosarcina radialis HA8281-LM2]